MLEKLGEVLRKATDKIANAIFLDKNLLDNIIKDLQRALIEADVNVVLVKQRQIGRLRELRILLIELNQNNIRNKYHLNKNITIISILKFGEQKDC